MKAPLNIYMTAPFPAPLCDDWGERFTLSIDGSGYTPSKEVFKNNLVDADVVVLNLDDVLDAEMIDAAVRLKVIALFAGSTDNIAVDYAQEKGIKIVTVMGEIFENTADLTFGLLLAVARRIPEADAWVRNGFYTQWHADLFLGSDVYKKTLGIVGLGTIGTAVARRAKGFDMEILYTAARGPKPDIERELGCKYVSLPELLTRSDFVSLHCKLSQNTYHIIGVHEMSLMKRSAFLINTGRGALIDEAALAEALSNRWFAGAALDVFEFEPQINEKLITLPNVVMTPHLGASSWQNRTAMAEYLRKEIIAALDQYM